MMPRPDGTSTLLLTNVVSSNFLDLLGVRPLLGRNFAAQDAAQLRARPGVVLSYRSWQRDFGGDPHIVGKQTPLRHGKDHINQVDVWGVLPPQFREMDANSDSDLWMPAESWATVVDPAQLTSTSFRWFNMVGRLAAGATVAQANDQVVAIAAARAAAIPADNRGRSARAVSDLKYRLETGRHHGPGSLRDRGRSGLARDRQRRASAVFARSGPCARSSPATLAGSHTLGRRTALLIENLLLCALGLVTGLALASALAALLPRLLGSGPAMINLIVPATTSSWIGASFFSPVCWPSRPCFCLPWFLSGKSPARNCCPPFSLTHRYAHLTRPPIAAPLASDRDFIRLARLYRCPCAKFPEHTNAVHRPHPPSAPRRVHAGTRRPMRDDVLTQLRALPGAEAAAYAIRSPLMPSEGGMATKVLLPGHSGMHDPVEIKYNAVSPDFLNVTGTRVIRGRGFIAADDANGPPVVLISQVMVQKFWPSQDPLGQVVRLPGFNDGKDIDARIIGVTENAPINQIGEIPEPYMYLPFRFSQMGEITFVVQTRQNAMSIAQNARQVFIHANPLLDPMFITSLPELIRSSTGDYQMMAELVSALGLIGLLLTIVGLYGFLAFRVTQRRREIGIRMALGASREATALLVLRDTLKLAAFGLGIGLIFAVLATRLERSVLFGVHPLDPVSLASAFTLLAVAALGASWLPARRAASIEPMQALRTE